MAESFIITRETLDHLRRKALRKGVWFRAISRMERGIVELAIRCVDKIRSTMLSSVLKKIIDKLSQSMNFLYRIMAVGRPIAEMMSRIAYSWGNEEALHWKDDPAYIRYLGLNALSGERVWYAGY